jgi:single-strand DNA-binding protein
MSINRVVISGNLTRDPELRQTQSGTAVLGFGVAVNDRRRNNQTGEWEDYANFVDCTMFGTRAQAISQYLRKGLKVAIEGKLHYSSWEDMNGGGKRSKIDVTVDEIEFMSGRNDNQGGYQQQRQQQRPTASQAGYQQPAQGGYQQQRQQPAQQVYVFDDQHKGAGMYDEDIPF